MDVPIVAVAVGYGIVGGIVRTMRDTYKIWKESGVFRIDPPDAFFDLFFGGAVGGLVWLFVGQTTTIDNPMTQLGLIGLGGFGADLIDPIMDKLKTIFGSLFPPLAGSYKK